MRWRHAFDDARRYLEATREQLDSPAVGLTRLEENVTRSRLEVLERIDQGIAGSREEYRTAGRRQDRVIGGLDEMRNELLRLREAVEALGTGAAAEQGDAPVRGSTPEEPAPGAGSGEEPGHVPAGPTGAPPPAPSDTDSQGGTMQNGDQRPGNGDRDHGRDRDRYGDHGQGRDGDHDQGQDHGLREAIEAAYRGVDGPAAPDARRGSAGRDDDPRIAHGVLLLKAAGVAAAELVVHRDTWEWLVGRAVGHAHFRIPPSVEDIGGGRVHTVLSGRTLIALLIELWDTRGATTPLDGDWAMATTAYCRIAAQLAEVACHGATVRIVLDDGLPGETDD